MPLRHAASRSFPPPPLTSPPRLTLSAPRPERSGGLERLPASCACSGEESSALARRVAIASPSDPSQVPRRHLPHRPVSAGPGAGGGGQRVVGKGASDDRRRLRMLLTTVCRGVRGARFSRRGSWMSLGRPPLVCTMRAMPSLMSCAHAQYCTMYCMYCRVRLFVVVSCMTDGTRPAQMCLRSDCCRLCVGRFEPVSLLI
jgi:hypothetical protein